MKRRNLMKSRLGVGLGLILISVAVYAASIDSVTGDDIKPADAKAANPKPTDSKKADAQEAKKAEKKPARKPSGAELYSMHCNRCHPERYPTERTAAQWKTIMLHMRVRANLPAEDARTILKFLQENSGR